MSVSATQTMSASTRVSRWITWIGRIVSVVPVFILLSSARWKLTHNTWYVSEWKRIGYAPNALNGIGLVQVACVVLFLIPQTAVLGTVLLTGYLGGAIASYVRIGEPYPVLVPLSTCLLAWAGIFLREERLRALLPFRKRPRG
ncbi:MAG TPA: DoxX family protein [Vicinamibacterales bacterium]|nr:DoxX family protein [Vicinamibacterales bacterium]